MTLTDASALFALVDKTQDAHTRCRAAEALGEKRVFTLDSDFYVYQRYGKEPLEVVP